MVNKRLPLSLFFSSFDLHTHFVKCTLIIITHFTGEEAEAQRGRDHHQKVATGLNKWRM